MSQATVPTYRSRLLTVLYWAVPPLLCLWLYYRGLWCWFHRDDFSLLFLVQLPDHEFWPQLWLPRAQGTFRPLSERLFFYYFYRWFGFDAFPYRLLVFITQWANLWLLAAVTRRLTGRRWAGFAAACIWGLHMSLATSMSWTSAYNQVLCSFFLLLSFGLFLRFTSTGNWIYYAAQWITFLLGCGSLETMVVYPAILITYTVLRDRRHWIPVAPMLLAAVALAWLQLQSAPPSAGGIYGHSYGVELIISLETYVHWALAAEAGGWTAVMLAGLLLLFAGLRAWQRDYRGFFLIAWFLGALAPYLPLAAHRSRYYLVIPFLGLAMLGGWAVEEAIRKGWAQRLVAVMSLALFFPPTISNASLIVTYDHRWSIAARYLATGLSQARAEHPNRTILLTNVAEELFYVAVYHDFFRLIGVFDVYLTPDHENIGQIAGFEPVDRFFLSREETLRALARGQAVVYDATHPRLTDVTRRYAALAPLTLEE